MDGPHPGPIRDAFCRVNLTGSIRSRSTLLGESHPHHHQTQNEWGTHGGGWGGRTWWGNRRQGGCIGNRHQEKASQGGVGSPVPVQWRRPYSQRGSHSVPLALSQLPPSPYPTKTNAPSEALSEGGRHYYPPSSDRRAPLGPANVRVRAACPGPRPPPFPPCQPPATPSPALSGTSQTNVTGWGWLLPPTTLMHVAHTCRPGRCWNGAQTSRPRGGLPSGY